MSIKLSLLTLFLVGFSHDNKSGGDTAKAKKNYVEKKASSHAMKYYISLPSNYDESKKWPVIFNIDGSGCQFDVSMKTWLNHKKRGYIVVTLWTVSNTQKEKYSQFYPKESFKGLKEQLKFDEEGLFVILDDITKSFNADKEKIFITGLSGGGLLTYFMIFHHNDKFTACAPRNPNFSNICASDSKVVNKDIPVHIFTAGADEYKSRIDKETENALKNLKDKGFSNFKTTEVPNVRHGQSQKYYDKILDFFDDALKNGKTVPSNDDKKEAIAKAAKNLISKDAKLKAKAIEELAELEAKEYVKEIAQTLKISAAELRISVIRALAMLSATDYVVEISQFLKDKDVSIQTEAVLALGLLGGKDRVKEIAKLIKTENKNLKYYVTLALGLLEAKDYVKEIAECLKDDNAKVRGASAWVLGQFGETKYAKDIAELLKSKEGIEKGYAILGLGELKAKDYVKEIKKLAKDSSSCLILDPTRKKIVEFKISKLVSETLKGLEDEK